MVTVNEFSGAKHMETVWIQYTRNYKPKEIKQCAINLNKNCSFLPEQNNLLAIILRILVNKL